MYHLSKLLCQHSPAKWSVWAKKNRHLLEVARSLLFSTHMPNQFWGEAVLTAAYLINRLPSRTLRFQTPCQLLKSYPNTHLISHLPTRIFGCSVFVHNHHLNKSKLDPKSMKCVFIGYSPTQKGYKCFYPDNRKVFISIDMTFHENQPYYPKNQIQRGDKSQSDRSYEFDFFKPMWRDLYIKMKGVKTIL